jgi:hypothetical protein
MTFKFLSTPKEYATWDAFNRSSLRGHYASYSAYLDSFTVYGGSCTIITANENGAIIGGIALVLFGKGPFKIVSAISGPIIEPGNEAIFPELIEVAYSHAKALGACMFQSQTLSHQNHSSPYVLAHTSYPHPETLHTGLPFRMTPISNQLFLVDLQTESDASWEDAMIAGFDRHARRRLKKAAEHPLEFFEVTDEAGVRQAYELIRDNGRTQGYSTREWEDYGPTMLAQIKRQEAHLFNVTVNGELIATHYGIIAGQRYFFMLAGTIRTDIDYSVGHFIHWNVMKFAHSLGLKAYDFGAVGSPGVLRFKKSFKPESIPFDTPSYYILSPFRFYLLNKLLPYVKKHKVLFSKLAKKLR